MNVKSDSIWEVYKMALESKGKRVWKKRGN